MRNGKNKSKIKCGDMVLFGAKPKRHIVISLGTKYALIREEGFEYTYRDVRVPISDLELIENV